MQDKGKTIFGALFVVALFVGAIFIAKEIQDNEGVQELIASFGYFGILIVSFIGGLNLFVPIPATAFIPIFSSAGFNLWAIIAVIIIGTTIADLVSFYIGTFLKPNADKIHNKVVDWLRDNCVGKPVYTGFVVFLYAAVIPIPNELLLLPLGTLGAKLKNLVIPFTLGTTVHVIAVAHGLTALI